MRQLPFNNDEEVILVLFKFWPFMHADNVFPHQGMHGKTAAKGRHQGRILLLSVQPGDV